MALRLVIGSLVLLLALGNVAALATNGHGSIYLTTLPPGATVWMDGIYMGETPLLVDGLDNGRHRVTFTRSGWQPQSTQADVIVGRVTTVSAILTQNAPQRGRAQAKGTLRVRGAPDVKVFVDGTAMQNETVPLFAGDHIITVQRGNVKTTSSFRIYPDTTTTISLAAQGNAALPNDSIEDELVALQDYVPTTDFTVNGDVITIHHNGDEVECAVGSRGYIFNGKPGTLSISPAMVGNRPFLPLTLLRRIAAQK